MHDVIEVKWGEEAERLGFLGYILISNWQKEKENVYNTKSHDKQCIQYSRIYKM